MTELEQIIIAHEGEKSFVYPDSLGYWTIGIGRLVDKRKGGGLSQDEMIYLLQNDIAKARNELLPYSWFNNLDTVRQEVLIELCFNIGLGGILEFKNTLALIEAKEYEKASQNLLESLWAKQVGPIRSQNMAKRLATGSYD